MAVKVERHVNLAAGVEVANVTNSLGGVHLVQQPLVPLAEADAVTVIGRNKDGSDATEFDVVRDWHEAMVEIETDKQCATEQKILRAAQVLGHKVPEGTPVFDPMEGTGYKGCCGG